MKRIIFLIFLFISYIFCVAHAQEQPVISDSIYSNILQEQRSLKVKLPTSYQPGSTDTYEVIYLTDGEWAMHPFSFIHNFAKNEDYVPPAIIVAIENKYIDQVNQRDRDFLPVHVPEPAISGGADKFLSFVKDELMPYIDKKYPTNQTNSIYGHSYGGVFTLYTLLAQPELFQSYYATDPPLGWNDDYLLDMAADKINLASDKILWIAGTSQNGSIARLDSLLRSKAPKNLHWESATYPNEKHNSVRLKAMYDGIKFAYSGYPGGSIEFHPMNGILLKDKPIPMFVNDNSGLYYTTDGTEPQRTSQKVGENLMITGPAELVLKSFSTSGKYDRIAKGTFKLGETLPSIAKPENIQSGGTNYSYYEGNWDKLPDFEKLTPVKTGIADSEFDINALSVQENYAFLFQGYIEISKDGYYLFALISNDGSKLFLGDQLIIDNDGVRSTESVKSFILPLEKGFYPVRVEYFNKDDNSVFQLLYLDPETQNAVPFPLKKQYYVE